MKILILLLALFSTVPGAQAAQSTNQAIPGTRISLSPPEGFTPSSQFSGFWIEALGATVMVSEFPGPMDEAVRGFDDNGAMTARGMILLHKQKVMVGRYSGFLFHIKQLVSDTEYVKWLLLFGEGQESVMIAANLPKALEKDLSPKMKASILTATWDRDKQVSPTDGLNFTLAEKGDIRFAKRMVETLLYTKNAVFPSKSPDDPLFIVGRTVRKVQVEDKQQFAKTRISQTASVKLTDIGEATEIAIDGLSGYEILAKAIDLSSGTPMMVYQVILYGDQTYYLMQGLISSSRGPEYVAVFREMAQTFKLKK